MTKNDKRTINGWAFFDWANSSYYLVISTAVFPIYFSSVTDEQVTCFGQQISNTALYSFSVSLAYVFIALLTPILSGIADYSGRRMRFLQIFTLMGSIGCMILFLFQGMETLWIGVFGFILGTIGAAGGLVFYDSYLPIIATEDQYDRVSAKGYAYGYFGSVLLLIGCLVIIQKPEWFGISNATLPSRISFMLVGIWWLGFSRITFARLPKDVPQPLETKWLTKGWNELKMAWQVIKNDRQMIRYLTAYFFYIAGVHTVIYLASLFADRELHFEKTELIITILLLQIVAIPGAYLFAAISKRYGNKLSLMVQLGIWIIICIGAYLTTAKWQFFSIAALVGMVLGGIQSLSRATYAKILEDRKEELTSLFSFYDVLTKVAIVSGTFLFGLVNSMTGNMRASVLVLATFFVIGFTLLSTVNKVRLNTVAKVG